MRIDSRILWTRIDAQRNYPKDVLGYPPTAVADRGLGAWRQGYESAIDDVLLILDALTDRPGPVGVGVQAPAEDQR